jgi:excisionase family DNA binding protein
MTQTNTENLLTLAQVRQRLQVSDRTVRRWVNDGSLPAVRLHGHGIRVRERDVQRLIQEDPRAGSPPDTER